ncbi:MAG: hypothetical protein L0Z62_47475 [Gemmataceae bacterium]|nr:hypothetical protein [Gemmataceae bacterium]
MPKKQTTGPTPEERLKVFLIHLDELNLTLYTSADGEEPYMEVPEDKIRVYYEVVSDRVQTWLWGKYMEVCGSVPLPAHLKAATMFLKDLAYKEGIKLPEAQKADRFNDDPVIASIHSWIGLMKGQSVVASASKAHASLKGYAVYHPNGPKFPKDPAALGRRLKVLQKEGFLAAIKISFEVEPTETAKVWTLKRTENADGLTVPRIVLAGPKHGEIKDLRTDGRPSAPDLTEPLEVDAEIERLDKERQEQLQRKFAVLRKGRVAKKQQPAAPGAEVAHTDPLPQEQPAPLATPSQTAEGREAES